VLVLEVRKQGLYSNGGKKERISWVDKISLCSRNLAQSFSK
jgi:hypothetical protein